MFIYSLYPENCPMIQVTTSDGKQNTPTMSNFHQLYNSTIQSYFYIFFYIGSSNDVIVAAVVSVIICIGVIVIVIVTVIIIIIALHQAKYKRKLLTNSTVIG